MAEEDEHEDKFIWRAEDPDIDLQQFLSESALEEFSHLFGAQLVLNPRQKAVALMNHADDGTIAEIYNRLCNVETWAVSIDHLLYTSSTNNSSTLNS